MAKRNICKTIDINNNNDDDDVYKKKYKDNSDENSVDTGRKPGAFRGGGTFCAVELRSPSTMRMSCFGTEVRIPWSLLHPNRGSLEEDKDEFYSQLQGVLTSVPKHDILMVLGDLNSKVGNITNGFETERNMQNYGLGLRNDNCQRFLNLCVENNLIIGRTIFKHKKIHKETWNSPDGVTTNPQPDLSHGNKPPLEILSPGCENYTRR
ncbi:craniofacial development protein 2 [Elysia marginata]|uniref:Craniofacial development protein 2 n=1 Tax=Elysia marginata TaxID=1093978 RepID=A0AAV4G481_9GAST|nr:craniofacial development protein 2 [Elysia marginata]